MAGTIYENQVVRDFNLAEINVCKLLLITFFEIVIVPIDDLDKRGVARVSDTLQAHMWPHMTMKKQKGTIISH